LRALAERAPSNDEVDLYGERALAERLEARVAELLGKEAAVWMPSGTMAQQIALRIHCERRGNRRIAFHPQCHLDVHEKRGYAHLHGLHADLLGSRERLPRQRTSRPSASRSGRWCSSCRLGKSAGNCRRGKS
jgi:threonine aldolase